MKAPPCPRSNAVSNDSALSLAQPEKFRNRVRKHLLAACLLSMAFLAGPSQAATVTWTGASGADWNTSGNPPWSNGTKPGSGDTALFNTTLASVANVVADQSVSSISFDTNAGTGSSTFTIGSTGGNKLILTNAGTTQILSTLAGTGKAITINAPVTLSPASPTGNGAYAFSNNSADSSNTLNFGGAIGSGNTTLATTLTLSGANTGNNTISGIISNGSATGGVYVTKTGAGTWVLGADNTFTGRVVLQNGMLKLGSNQTTNREWRIGGLNAGENTTFDLAGYSVLAGNGLSVQLNNTAPTVAGLTSSIIDSSVGKTGVLKLTYNLVYYSGGAGKNNGQATISANVDLNSALRIIDVADSDQTTTEVVISGNISSTTGSIRKDSAGTLVLGGNNTYGGTTTITGGLIQLNVAENAGTSGPLGKPTTLANSIVLNGGGLQFTTNNIYDYTTSGRLQLADAKTGTIDTNGQTVTFANAIGVGTLKTGALTKTGAGTLTLGGTNTYTGVTTVSVGTLLVNGNNSAATGAVSVAASATLGGNGTIGAAVTSNATTAIFAPGSSAGTAGKLTLANTLNLASGANFKMDIGSAATPGTTYDQIALTGAGALGVLTGGNITFDFNSLGGIQTGTPYTLLTFASSTGLSYSNLSATTLPSGYQLDTGFGDSNSGWKVNAGNLQVQFAIPEPATWALLAFSLTTVVILRRRRA